MRLTIIADDNAVYVDGEALYPIDLSDLDPTIHAVQWTGSRGEIEYRSDEDGNRRPNERISDVAPYQVFVDRWNAAKAAQAAQVVVQPPTPTPTATSTAVNVIAV